MVVREPFDALCGARAWKGTEGRRARPIEWLLMANELARREIGGTALKDERRHRVSGVAGEYSH